MSLTLVSGQTLTLVSGQSGAAFARRRPRKGFHPHRPHRLTLVPAGKQTLNDAAVIRTARKPMPDNLIDIAAHRTQRAGQNASSAPLQAGAKARRAWWRLQWRLALAAAAPPAIWLSHAIMHLF